MNDLISIIIPVKNGSKYLSQAIEGILSQNMNVEIIVADDCSTDDSRDIIEKYKNDKHISHIEYNISNSGNTFKQWDKGIRITKGELIWIAESDDVAHPDFLSHLVEQMTKHPNAVLAFSHSFLIDHEGNDMHINWHSNNDTDTVFVHNGNKYAHKIMVKNNSIYNASMVVFRKSIYKSIDKTFLKYKSCGDWAFWMSACLQGDVLEVCQRLNYYRQHPKKVTVKAGQAGTAWMAAGSLLHEFTTMLNMKGWELHVFRGHWTNDLNNSLFPNKEKLTREFPDVFASNALDYVCFKLSRIYERITQSGHSKQ